MVYAHTKLTSSGLGGRTATRRGSAPQARENPAGINDAISRNKSRQPPAAAAQGRRHTVIGHVSCDIRGLPFAHCSFMLSQQLLLVSYKLLREISSPRKSWIFHWWALCFFWYYRTAMLAHLRVKMESCMRKAFLPTSTAASVSHSPTTRIAGHVVPVSENVFTSFYQYCSIDLVFFVPGKIFSVS